MLREVIERLRAIPTRVSLFIDPVPTQVEAAKEVGADAVELYTGPYAKNYLISPEQAIRPYEVAAQRAADIGLRLHAGHDLNLENLRFLRQHLPNLAEVSIGHALIADALYLGIAETLRRYRQALTL
jgi:pyridoxine 5-phosphate synthase